MIGDDAGDPTPVVRYPDRAHDVVRFLDDPADARIAELVRKADALEPEQRQALRAAIGTDEAYTLLTFARRRTVSALRLNSLSQALEAVRGLTLVTRSEIDYRDLSVDFPLYAVRELVGTSTPSWARRSRPANRAPATALPPDVRPFAPSPSETAPSSG